MTLLHKRSSNNTHLTTMVNTSISTPVVNQKVGLSKSLEKRTVGKQSNDLVQLVLNDPTTTTITSSTYDTKIATLQAIKQKFMPKEIIALPWDKYNTNVTATIDTVVHTQKNHNQHRHGTQYDQIIQDLAWSHARVAASEFQILSIVEAEQQEKKTDQLKKQLDFMYEQLRVSLNTTRASVKSLYLSVPRNMEILQLKEHVCKTEKEFEEFYFMNKYANHVETRYLQHLAGTLLNKNGTCGYTSDKKRLSCIDKQEDKKEEYDLRIILNLLRDILDQKNEEIISVSTQQSPSSLLSLDSSVYLSSSSSLVEKSNLCSTTPRTCITTDQSAHEEVIQEINLIIEKISHLFKQQKDTIQSFERRSRNTDTIEELMKQRERSAELVLQLEKNRSQRLLLWKKKELEMVKLKEQLNEEKTLRKSLQTRIETMEQELIDKEKLVDSFDLELKNLKDQRNNDKDEIHELKSKVEIQQKQNKINEVEVNRNSLLQLKQEKINWLKKEKKILNQCSTVVQVESCINLEDTVTQLVQKYKQEKEVSKELERGLEEAKKCIFDRQAIIDKLSVEKDGLLKKLEFVISKCCVEIDNETELDKTDLKRVVEETIKILKSKSTATTLEEDRAKKYRIKHTNSLLKLKQQELIQLQEKCDNAIKLYTTRESAYILQSASTEAELGRLLKEYDRLTRNITDFNNERKKFEDEIQKLQVEKIQLSRQLCDEHIIKIYGNDSVLRKEFRDLMNTVKEKHKEELLTEINSRRKVEQELRDKMSEIESKRWEKVDIAVQTYLQLS